MTRRVSRRHGFGWFVAWSVVGAGYVVGILGALSIGIFVLPFAVLGTVLITRHDGSSSAMTGLVAGLGLPLLYVSYLNRSGPGIICTTSATIHDCAQEWSPWPWLVSGLLLVAGGLAAFVVLRHLCARQRTRIGR
jgi:hypothetical protein